MQAIFGVEDLTLSQFQPWLTQTADRQGYPLVPKDLRVHRAVEGEAKTKGETSLPTALHVLNGLNRHAGN